MENYRELGITGVCFILDRQQLLFIFAFENTKQKCRNGEAINSPLPWELLNTVCPLLDVCLFFLNSKPTEPQKKQEYIALTLNGSPAMGLVASHCKIRHRADANSVPPSSGVLIIKFAVTQTCLQVDLKEREARSCTLLRSAKRNCQNSSERASEVHSIGSERASDF